MSEITPRLVYYDANIWIAWMRGSTDKLFSQARLLIDNVLSGKNIAVVSYLVILEEDNYNYADLIGSIKTRRKTR